MLSSAQRCSSKRFIFGSPTGNPSPADASFTVDIAAAANGMERKNWRRCMNFSLAWARRLTRQRIVHATLSQVEGLMMAPRAHFWQDEPRDFRSFVQPRNAAPSDAEARRSGE